MAQPSRRSVLGVLGATPVAALAVGASPAAAAGTQSNAVPAGLRPGGQLDKLIADLAARDEFSGTVRLAHRNRTVLARSYGMADKQRAIPNGPDTAFALASVTKMFTATAIAHLAQRRKLTYRATLGSFLDGFPSSIADTVTVHHLLTHTSGLGDYHSMPGFADAAAGWTTQAQAMAGITEFIKKSELAFAPGARWAYSNSGFHLLGAIVEKASGRSYFDYVRDNVFAAAGMTSTRFLTAPEWETDRKLAHPYHRDAQGQWVDGIPDFGYVVSTPAGDAFSTCADLDRFGRFLWQERIVDHGQTALMLSGKVLPAMPPGPPPGGSAGPLATFQCYGPTGSLIGGQWTFGHGGGNSSGVSTSIDIYPESDWTVVVLSNYPNVTIQSISYTARNLITG
ncbi:serine hydrolase domain-containing protein [Kribbella sp. NPDC055110]